MYETAARKTHKHYWFFRIYTVVVILAWNIVCFWEFVRAVTRSEPPFFVFFLIPFFIPAIFMCCNLAAFKYDYSIFGTLERTAVPNDFVIQEVRNIGGRIGWLRASGPFVAWKIHPDGLSFHVLLIGSGYVDYSQITGIKSRFGFGCSVSHSSSEVRSPLIIYDKKICVALSQHAAQRGVECDLITT